MKTLLTLSALLLLNTVYAGIYPQNAGIRSKALGNTMVSNNNHWGIFGNTALMSLQEKSSIGLSVHNRFGVSDLNTATLASSLKTKEGSFGIGFSHYGVQGFNRQNLSLGFGRKFDKLMVGAGVSYINTSFGSYTNIGGVTLNIGLAYAFNSRLMFAFSGNNINRARLIDYPEERLESTYLMGLKYSLSEELVSFSELEYEYELEQYIGKFGLEWKLKKELSFLIGLATDREVLNFGAMYSKSVWNAGFAMSYHQYLGFSPSFSVSYSFGK